MRTDLRSVKDGFLYDHAARASEKGMIEMKKALHG
jgi:hypothetical protein